MRSSKGSAAAPPQPQATCATSSTRTVTSTADEACWSTSKVWRAARRRSTFFPASETALPRSPAFGRRAFVAIMPSPNIPRPDPAPWPNPLSATPAAGTSALSQPSGAEGGVPVNVRPTAGCGSGEMPGP